jgi:hypothetical protein
MGTPLKYSVFSKKDEKGEAHLFILLNTGMILIGLRLNRSCCWLSSNIKFEFPVFCRVINF